MENKHSTRFGKICKVNYGKLGRICSLELKTFLLESMRVTHQDESESNFKILHQLSSELKEGDEEKKFDEGFTSTQ